MGVSTRRWAVRIGILCVFAVMIAVLLMPAPGARAIDEFQEMIEGGFGSGPDCPVVTLGYTSATVYAGTAETSGGCRLFRYYSGVWSEVCVPGFGDANNTEISYCRTGAEARCTPARATTSPAVSSGSSGATSGHRLTRTASGIPTTPA